ncbi:MAG: tyrosine--tRNA ligase [Bryobacteraceae bacterium]
MHDLIAELRWRGFLAQTTTNDVDQFLTERRSIYVGFDPTAASLHLGSLIPVMGLAHAQRAGHRPIVLVGGGTGLIGDPSGKQAERVLLTRDKVEENCEGIRKQLSRFLDLSTPDHGLLLNNADWLCSLELLAFLRDIGKHFSVNEMIKRDSVRMRLEERDQGISYTEFSYMLLQAYDFLYLAQHYGCTVQMGGSDQWGNILSGADLIRRILGERAEGITFPLLTTSTGKKFGKTEEGAVWLDPDLTSPYQMYQYWIQTADADVVAYLKLFTFLGPAEIDELAATVIAKPEARAAQKALASDCTRIVHGGEAVAAVEQATQILFGSADLVPDRATIDLLAREVPSSRIPRSELEAGIPMLDLLVRTRLAESKGAARKLLEGGGVYINNRRQDANRKAISTADVVWPQAVLLRSGKKSYHLVRVE